ncbi:RhuM family protein [Microbacterium xylanilyticum]
MDDGDVRIEMYEGAGLTIEVRAEEDSVWLSLDQLSALFARDKSTISRHVRNVFAEGEVEREAVVADFATTASDGKTYRVTHYNLDVIISVGYRVKSAEGVKFRQWATGILKAYMLEGVVRNERRLEELGSIVRVLGRSSDDVVAGIADIVSGYLPSLRTLRDFDAGAIDSAAGAPEVWVLTIEEARRVIDGMREEFPDDTLLGKERGEGLAGVIGAIYQGFAGQQIYPTVQEKAANLLYLIVKDHPLTDGNKRSAAALFVHFLAKNDALLDEAGETRVSNNALAALTLLIAMSDPKEKELLIALVLRMLNGEPV